VGSGWLSGCRDESGNDDCHVNGKIEGEKEKDWER
jgi:hypothetical protein